MKKKLGRIGMLICSVGMLALPAAAQERGYAFNNQSRQYSRDSRSHGEYAGNRKRGNDRDVRLVRYDNGRHEVRVDSCR